MSERGKAWLRLLPETRAVLGNTALALGLTAVSMTLFWFIGYTADPATAATLRTSLDDRIPFLPWTVYLYSWVYTAMLYPLFVVRSPRLFRHTVAAYAIVLGVSQLTFALFPVTAAGFRPDVSHLDSSIFHNWGTQLTFWVDPPMNLFPSQHVSVATIAFFAAWRARRAYGLLILPVALGVLVSISTMKQHYLVDGLAGVLLAAVAAWIALRSYPADAEPVARRAYSWRGPALYFLVHALFYGLFLGLFLAGYKPWLDVAS